MKSYNNDEAVKEPKQLTNDMVVEHNIKQYSALITLLTKASHLIDGDDEDISDNINTALSLAKRTLDWYTSGEALKEFNDGSGADYTEDADMYAPGIYTLNGLDLSAIEETPEWLASYEDAKRRKDLAFDRDITTINPNILDALKGAR